MTLARRVAPSGYLPQERERRDGETVREFLPAAPASRRRGGDGRRRGRAGASARRRRRPLRRRPSSAGSPSAAPTSTTAAAAVASDLGSHSTWTCRCRRCRAGRRRGSGWPRCCCPVRRVPAGRADERPGPRRAGAAGGLRRGPALRHRRGQPRPGVPVAHRHRRARDRPAPAAGHVVRRRLRRVPRGARGRAPARARGVRGLRRPRAAPGGRGRGCSGPGWRRASRTPGARPPTTTRSCRKFRAETTEKQAAKARQTERMIERLDVVEEPRKEWELQMTIAAAPRSGEVVATLRSARRRRGTSASGRSTCSSTGRDRVAVTGPNGGGKTTLLAVLLGRHRRSTRAAPRSGRVRRSARSTRPAGCSSAARRSSRPSAGRCPTGRPRTCAPCLRSSGSVLDHVHRPAATLSPGERTRAGARPAAGPRGQPARARRADQPPGPARDRAAGAGAGLLRRHASFSSPTTAGCCRPCGSRAAGRSPTARSPRSARTEHG